MVLYITLWAIIQYHFILLLKWFQLWQLGALSVGSCVPDTLHQCGFLQIVPWYYQMLRLMLGISCPSSSAGHFSKVHRLLFMEVVLETKT